MAPVRKEEGRWVLESTQEKPKFNNWDRFEHFLHDFICNHLLSHHHGYDNPFFDRGEPSKRWLWYFDEDCAFINTNEKWNDFSCNLGRFQSWTINPLCEKTSKRQNDQNQKPEKTKSSQEIKASVIKTVSF